MNKKSIALVIAGFLAVLFLSTVGSLFTGYTVFDQSEITLKNYPYPFIKNNVYNDLYIIVPSEYSQTEYDIANKIAYSLKGNQPLLPRIITDNKLPQGEHNLILIGNPCNNKLIARELGTGDCDLNSGQGLIKLVNYKVSSALIISGDLEKASRVLTRYRYYPLRSTNIFVSGTEDLSLKYL